MESAKPRFAKYIFVCENDRADGSTCCSQKGATALRERLKQAVKERGLADKIRVSRSGCLDVCAEGANVLLMPDHIWFKGVEEKDVDRILGEAAKG